MPVPVRGLCGAPAEAGKKGMEEFRRPGRTRPEMFAESAVCVLSIGWPSPGAVASRTFRIRLSGRKKISPSFRDQRNTHTPLMTNRGMLLTVGQKGVAASTCGVHACPNPVSGRPDVAETNNLRMRLYYHIPDLYARNFRERAGCREIRKPPPSRRRVCFIPFV